jgi:hypothetical protein
MNPQIDGSLTLHPTGATASYTFQVTPSLATLYQVALFKNSAAAKPLATSRPTTVYVTMDGITGSAPSTACNQSIASTEAGYLCRQSAWCAGPTYGKEKVYGSIP